MERRQQAGLKKRIIQYLGTSIAGTPDKPGGFKGIQHTLDSPEAKKAGKKYWNLLMNEYQKLTDIMEKQAGPKWVDTGMSTAPKGVGGQQPKVQILWRKRRDLSG